MRGYEIVALSVFLNGCSLDSYDLPVLYKSSQKLTFEFMLQYISAENSLPVVEVNTKHICSLSVQIMFFSPTGLL